MKRPQFSLKTLLWLMAVVAAASWAISLDPPHSYGVIPLVACGFIGWLAGSMKGRAHAMLFAILGFFFAMPLMIAAYLILAVTVGID